MGCCCKKPGGETNTRKEAKCCVCNPFGQDAFLLTAKIASILAACISWTWWPIFVLAAPVVSTLQVTWCCRMKKGGLYAVIVMSTLAFVGSLFIGIWMITECWDTLFVVIDDQSNNNNYYTTIYENGYEYEYHYQYCSSHHRGVAWGTVALVDAALFLLVALSTLYFVRVQYDAIVARRMEEEAQDETYVQTVEMAVAAPTMTPEATATMISPECKV